VGGSLHMLPNWTSSTCAFIVAPVEVNEKQEFWMPIPCPCLGKITRCCQPHTSFSMKKNRNENIRKLENKVTEKQITRILSEMCQIF
jgi:hypothetical protein